MKTIMLTTVCVTFLIFVQLNDAKAVDQSKFLQILSKMPLEEQSIFKQLASEVLTNDSQLFIAQKDPQTWFNPIMQKAQGIISKLQGTEETKEKSLQKLRFIVQFLLDMAQKNPNI